MFEKLTDILEPSNAAPVIRVFSEKDGRIVEGVIERGKEWFPIINGVPCFLKGLLRPDFSEFAQRHGLSDADASGIRQTKGKDQAQTNVTFSDNGAASRHTGLRPPTRSFCSTGIAASSACRMSRP